MNTRTQHEGINKSWWWRAKYRGSKSSKRSYNVQWWSNLPTHLLQTEQCFVRLVDVWMLHKWQRLFSMTCRCLARSNSGTTCLGLILRSSASAGSISSAARCAIRWMQKIADNMPHSGRWMAAGRAGSIRPKVALMNTVVAIHPNTCSGWNGSCSPLRRRSLRYSFAAKLSWNEQIRLSWRRRVLLLAGSLVIKMALSVVGVVDDEDDDVWFSLLIVCICLCIFAASSHCFCWICCSLSMILSAQ